MRADSGGNRLPMHTVSHTGHKRKPNLQFETGILYPQGVHRVPPAGTVGSATDCTGDETYQRRGLRLLRQSTAAVLQGPPRPEFAESSRALKQRCLGARCARAR